MSRPNPLVLIGILAILTACYGWLTYSSEGLFTSAHEGDTYHLIDILFRINAGQVPHLDFVTPIGVLAFLPFTFLMSQGLSAGDAILTGQLGVAGLFLPLVAYVCLTRLSPVAGYVFAAMMVIFAMALSFGGIGAGLSMSMHYNRWAWVAGSLITVIALCPRKQGAIPVVDGVLLGLLFSALALTKMTFFVALLPGTCVALLLSAQKKELMIMIVTGAAVAGGLLVSYGPQLWLAYASDLLTVAGSEVRPHTGRTLADIVASAPFIAITGVGFAAYLLFSRAELKAQAIGMILFLPGFLFITWQNFGNDPKWLVPLFAVLLTMVDRMKEDDRNAQRMGMVVLATLAGVLYLPSAMTMALSPLKHAAQAPSDYDPMLGGARAESGLFVRLDRAYAMRAETALDDPGDPWSRYADRLDLDAPTEINGIPFPTCEFLAGSVGWTRILAEDLTGLGVEQGAQLFTADILSSFWLYEAFDPLQNGAPWYYGNLSGIENADYVVVPKCGFAERVRQIIINDLATSGLEFETVAETDRLALFRVAQ